MAEVCYYCNKLLGAFIEKTVVQLQPKKGYAQGSDWCHVRAM